MPGVTRDPAEFEGWFRAHHAAVRRFAYRRVDPESVDDVVAETFLIAWRRRDDIVGEPLAWLLGIARRVCANQLRGSGRRMRLLRRLAREPALVGGGPPGSDPLLRAALGSLREADREVLLLVAWDGLSHAAAAKVLGCSTSTFGVRAHRARARLAGALAELGERPRVGEGQPTPWTNGGSEGVIADDTI